MDPVHRVRVHREADGVPGGLAERRRAEERDEERERGEHDREALPHVPIEALAPRRYKDSG